MTKDELEVVTTGDEDVVIEETSPDALAKELEDLLEAASRLEQTLDDAGLTSKSVGTPAGDGADDDTAQEWEEGEKSAATFGRQIAALAEGDVSERVREYLRALAIVVRIAKPGEFGALAAILSRVAPKSVKEQADKIAEKMAKEGGSAYGYPYPAPNSEEKSFTEVVAHLEGRVNELSEVVAALSEQVRQAQEVAQKALDAAPRPSVTPIAREVATPVGVLAQKLIGG